MTRLWTWMRRWLGHGHAQEVFIICEGHTPILVSADEALVRAALVGRDRRRTKVHRVRLAERGR